MFLTGLDRVLNDAGVSWTARPGWRTRTAHRGGLREVRAVIWHTTETVSSAFRNSTAPTLGYVESGLGYNLYNILIGRDGRAYLIAAGTAAHAGKGSGHGMPRDQANYYSFGISFDSNNNTTPINAAQLETGARIGAAIDREWKNSLDHVMHGEWAPGRRSDPTKVPGGWGALRAAIGRGSWSTTPAPDPSDPLEEIMSWYDSKAEFEKAMFDNVMRYTNPKVTGGDKQVYTLLRHAADDERIVRAVGRLIDASEETILDALSTLHEGEPEDEDGAPDPQ